MTENNEEERTWKKLIIPKFQVHWTDQGKPHKTSDVTVNIQAKIQTRHLNIK
jgi:hypothetical protein